MKRQLCVAVVALALLASPATAQVAADPVYAAFRAAVAEYLALQKRLRIEAPPLTVTDSARQINDASDVLAGAVQRARPRAKQGDLFDRAAARAMTARLRKALDGADVSRLLVAINDEPALKGPPRVHMRFPGASSMATMPTHFLDALPLLPVELEYRLLGRSLILRDRDAALIVDYIPQALPAPSKGPRR